MKTRIYLLAVAAAALLSGGANAHGDRHHGGFDRGLGNGFAFGGLRPGIAPAPPLHLQGFGGYQPHAHFRRFHGGAVILLGSPFAFGYPMYTESYPIVQSAAPPVYIERATDDEIRQQPGGSYFCPDYGYYPTVQSCPIGWMLVKPAEPQQ